MYLALTKKKFLRWINFFEPFFLVYTRVCRHVRKSYQILSTRFFFHPEMYFLVFKRRRTKPNDQIDIYQISFSELFALINLFSQKTQSQCIQIVNQFKFTRQISESVEFDAKDDVMLAWKRSRRQATNCRRLNDCSIAIASFKLPLFKWCQLKLRHFALVMGENVVWGNFTEKWN